MEEDNFGYRNLIVWQKAMKLVELVYAHFLSIARGSLYETMTQLEIATNLGYVEKSKEVEDLAVEIRRMLSTLMHRFLPQKS